MDFRDEQLSKDAAKHGIDNDHLRMFAQASYYHQTFVSMTQKKHHGIDMEKLKECAQLSENGYLQLLNSYPDWDQLIYQLATLYMQTNRNGLAMKLLEPLCVDKPRLEFINNLGAAYRNENINDKATETFKRCLEIERNPDVLANLAALYVNEGCPEVGIPYGRECLAREPLHPQGRWNLGLLLMENGEWAEGFNLYAQGFETGERIIRSYKNSSGDEAQFWKGEDLNGKTIVMHGEQGIGDELLFLQFIPFLKEKYPEARIILDVHPRLERAIRRSYPEYEIYPTRKTAPVWNEEVRVDYKDGMGSLPKYFWHRMGENHGWLKPDMDLVRLYVGIIEKLQKELGQEGLPVVGVGWEGGKKKTRTDLRSIGLQEWGPILQNECTFISLQYTPEAAKEVSELRDQTGLVIHHWPDVVENFDYDHTIALVAATHLIVTVNTSTVHVCGSMDHSCWTMTPHGHAWRYGKKEKINPFYKTVEQFHQAANENWKRIIHKVGYRLAYVNKEVLCD